MKHVMKEDKIENTNLFERVNHEMRHNIEKGWRKDHPKANYSLYNILM